MLESILVALESRLTSCPDPTGLSIIDGSFGGNTNILVSAIFVSLPSILVSGNGNITCSQQSQ